MAFPLILGDQTLSPRSSAKILGVTIDSRLNFKEHLDKVKMKANSSLSILTNLGKSTWGVSLQERRNVYQATILPHILYCSSVWANTRNTMAAKALTTIQAQAARYILGAYKRTSGEALDKELYLELTQPSNSSRKPTKP